MNLIPHIPDVHPLVPSPSSDISTMSQDWRDLVQSARQRGFLHSAASITGLGAVVKACKLQLKRLGVIATPGHSLFTNTAWEVRMAIAEAQGCKGCLLGGIYTIIRRVMH